MTDLAHRLLRRVEPAPALAPAAARPHLSLQTAHQSATPHAFLDEPHDDGLMDAAPRTSSAPSAAPVQSTVMHHQTIVVHDTAEAAPVPRPSQLAPRVTPPPQGEPADRSASSPRIEPGEPASAPVMHESTAPTVVELTRLVPAPATPAAMRTSPRPTFASSTPIARDAPPRRTDNPRTEAASDEYAPTEHAPIEYAPTSRLVPTASPANHEPAAHTIAATPAGPSPAATPLPSPPSQPSPFQATPVSSPPATAHHLTPRPEAAPPVTIEPPAPRVVIDNLHIELVRETARKPAAAAPQPPRQPQAREQTARATTPTRIRPRLRYGMRQL